MVDGPFGGKPAFDDGDRFDAGSRVQSNAVERAGEDRRRLAPLSHAPDRHVRSKRASLPLESDEAACGLRCLMRACETGRRFDSDPQHTESRGPGEGPGRAEMEIKRADGRHRPHQLVTEPWDPITIDRPEKPKRDVELVARHPANAASTCAQGLGVSDDQGSEVVRQRDRDEEPRGVCHRPPRFARSLPPRYRPILTRCPPNRVRSLILLVDNYDSFVFNLARYFEELGENVRVVRNDELDIDGIRALEPTHVVLSPGPCTPAEAGISVNLLRAPSDRTPILGVCLGHQCIAAAFGGSVVRAARPMHGIVDEIEHDRSGLFTGLPSPFVVTRYHSLVVPETAAGTDILVTARSRNGEVMGLAHRSRPIWGVQFHPEAVRTFGGHRLLANFLALGRGEPARSVQVPAEMSREIP